MYVDLVCKGGGVKGIALVGAICCLEDQGYLFKNIAGTSVGAIVASLLAVGYTGKEIKDIIFSIDFKAFADKNRLQSIPAIGQLSSLFTSKGIYAGNYIEKFLWEKFKVKGKTSFKDLIEDGESRLKIIATDITRHTLIVLPDDLIKYNIDPLSFDIARAVRMSLSIPFFYNPVVLNKKNNPSYIVDGGLISNFPIWLFDVKGTPKWPTFGLNLYNNVPKPPSNNHGLLSFLMDVVETSLSTNEDIYFKDSDAIRIINIPTLGVGTVDFDLSKNDMINLYNSGYNATKDFLEDWNFNSYIQRYRS